ncbi:MAG: serine hydrolase domain-containing protein [Aquihabitans sp.]
MAKHEGMKRLEGLQERMASHVTDGGVGGLTWAVSLGDDVLSGSAGWLDPNRHLRPMPLDGIFRIASVSKPIVAIAALQMVEEGLVELDAPIDAALPELADRRVLSDPNGPVDQATVPAERPLSLRDLLTFRCGLGMDFDFSVDQPLLDRLWELGIGPGPTAPGCTPDEYLAKLGVLPLAEQPGTRWRYHTGSDIVSVLIERVRGTTLDEVLARDVFVPLGMVDTGFWARPDQLDRFGACRMAEDDGVLRIWDDPKDGRWSSPPAFRSGATGLISTAADLVRLGQMFLHHGEGSDGPVLSPRYVAEMTTDQLSDHQREVARIDGLGTTLGWGLGTAVHREQGTTAWPPAGAFGWDGGLGSRWIVDPTRALCAVLLTTDGLTSPDLPVVMDDFYKAIATAL